MRGTALALLSAALVVTAAGGGNAAATKEVAGVERSSGAISMDLSTSAAVRRYLRSLGLSATLVVVQRGARNYAGPRCPGKRWTCTRSRTVVQIARSGGKNRFECTNGTDSASGSAQACTIVQVGPAENVARCVERTHSANSVQTCTIVQSNENRPNRAVVSQVSDQEASEGTQDGLQTAKVTQTNVSGANRVHITQKIEQLLRHTGEGEGIDEVQDGHLWIAVRQTSETGDNRSTFHQAQKQRARATGAPSITQLQNTEERDNSEICPLVTDSLANACAQVVQESDSGKIRSWGSQSFRQRQVARDTETGAQMQGLVDPTQGGGDHFFRQTSSGISRAFSRQTERLRQIAKNTGDLTKTQHGPFRKGTDSSQEGNGADRIKIEQRSTLLSAADAIQTDLLLGGFVTSGHGIVRQRVSIQGQVTTNSCEGHECLAEIACGDLSPPSEEGPGSPYEEELPCVTSSENDGATSG
jgi:hypothetical protein